MKPLDTRRFAPEAELHFSEIENNTLAPTKPGDRPDKGNAQIWRASLTVDATGRMRRCWVLRRIGSGIGKSLELVSGERLRSALALEDGDVVFVEMEGTWVP